jgi:hypothetical protein
MIDLNKRLINDLKRKLNSFETRLKTAEKDLKTLRGDLIAHDLLAVPIAHATNRRTLRKIWEQRRRLSK